MFLRKTTVATPSSPPIQYPSNWLDSLADLLKALKQQEFQTVDALLAAVAFDDVAGGSMLKRILYWQGRLGREFYLSNQDWWEQCRVKRSAIDCAKKLFPKCGVMSKVKFSKSANANVTHYQLNAAKFSRRLAEVLGVSVLHLAERLVGIQQNVVSESSRTLTRESTSNTTKEHVVNKQSDAVKKIVDFKSALPTSSPEQLLVIELLKKAGVQGGRAVAYALLPEKTVRDCIRDAQSAMDAGRVSRDKRIGYLIGALRNQQAALKVQPRVVSELVADVFVDEPTIAESHSVAIPETEPMSEKLLVMVSERLTAYDAWSATYHQLELQLDSGSFDTWLRSAKLVDYEPDCLVVKVHNSYARDMCQHRIYKTATRILRDVTGREMAIRYEADEQSAASSGGIGRFLKMSANK